MGVQKGAQKARKEKPSSPTWGTKEEVPPPQPPSIPGEAMIPTSKLEELLQLANPNINWATTIMAMTQVWTTNATGSTTPVTGDQPEKGDAPPVTVDSPQNIAPTEEAKNPETSEISTPTREKSPVAPLDVTPISVYESGSTIIGNLGQEIEKEGESTTSEEKVEPREEMTGSEEQPTRTETNDRRRQGRSRRVGQETGPHDR